jgi:hypothetical protein
MSVIVFTLKGNFSDLLRARQALRPVEAETGPGTLSCNPKECRTMMYDISLLSPTENSQQGCPKRRKEYRRWLVAFLRAEVAFPYDQAIGPFGPAAIVFDMRHKRFW